MSVEGKTIETYRRIPRQRLVNLDTPIEACERLRKRFAGCPHLYIKRDDFVGYLVGGNKARKLEYVMADVLARKATTVVTVGSVQSNYARITSMVAKRLGLRCCLVLNGKPPDVPRGNFFINKLLGAEIHFVGSRAERNPRMEELAGELTRRGESVYRIPLGASDEIGSFGLVAALEEVVNWQRRMGVELTALIIGSSSGGTQAGLEVGKRLFGLSGLRIIGVSPDDPADSIRETILGIVDEMSSRLGLNGRLSGADIIIDENFIGRGYGIHSEESREALNVFSEVEGILLDPVYTSKAAAACLDYCRRGVFGPDDHVLFWHTGGLLELF